MTATTALPSMTSRELLTRLRRHYLPPKPMPGGIFVEEVGTNGGPGTRCDAIHIGFTSTSGRIITGHEVKISRSDWLAELRKDGKADWWHDNCHAWYVVAPSVEIVHPDELPHGWGLLVPWPNNATKASLQRVVRAETRTADPSWTAARSIIARWDTLRLAEIDKARHDERAKLADDLRELGALRAERAHGRSANHELIDEVLTRATVALHSEETWRSIDPADVVLALVDLTRANAAAEDLKRVVSARVASLRRAIEAIEPTYGPLAALLKDMQ